MASLEDDVVAFCSRLIRFDTSNFGAGESRGEREAAEWVAGVLAADGYEPEVVEAAPGRASTVVRLPGTDPSAPALLAHAHLDVVPAQAADWSFDPFGGEVRDGAVLGRGALDMKNTAAALLAVARDLARAGERPSRDVVLAFVADEEDTGRYGAGFLVHQRPELFAGVTAAVGETGGELTVLPDGSPLYAVATGERGSAWLRLTAHGPAGHGSRTVPDNAVAVLARTVAALDAIEWPVRLTPTVRQLLDGIAARLGVALDPADRAGLARHLGDAYPLVERTLANSLTPTMLAAGYKVNVVPSEAVAHVDGRVVPGFEDEFFATVDALLPAGVERAFDSWSPPVGADTGHPEFGRIEAALVAHDPDALVLPFVMGGGTDAKSFAELGIDCFGFAPARTPVGFPMSRYVHGVDEQVPVDSLHFAARVLRTYLTT